MAECNRNKKESAMCALCDKAHSANYRCCQQGPKPRKATPVTQGRSLPSVAAQRPQARQIRERSLQQQNPGHRKRGKDRLQPKQILQDPGHHRQQRHDLHQKDKGSLLQSQYPCPNRIDKQRYPNYIRFWKSSRTYGKVI